MPKSREDSKRDDFMNLVHRAMRSAAHGTQTRADEGVLWAAAKLERGRDELRDLQVKLDEAEASLAALKALDPRKDAKGDA